MLSLLQSLVIMVQDMLLGLAAKCNAEKGCCGSELLYLTVM